MAVKFCREKQGARLRWLMLAAASTLFSNAAYAETTTTQANSSFKNEASLIQAIGNDPMVFIPAKESKPATGESAIIQQINKEQVVRPVNVRDYQEIIDPIA